MMKRILFVVLAIVLTLGLAGLSAAAKDKALFVCVADPINESDTAVVEKLEALGYEVVVVDHTAVADEDPNKFNLVVISATVTSSNIVDAPEYIGTTTPILHWESALTDDFGITSGTLGAVEIENPMFSIINKNHPIVAGLPVLFNPFEGLAGVHYGLPDLVSNTIALIEDTEGYAAVHAWEKGEKMGNDEVAAGRRVFLASGDNIWQNATPEGWKLFEQAVAWLVRK